MILCKKHTDDKLCTDCKQNHVTQTPRQDHAKHKKLIHATRPEACCGVICLGYLHFVQENTFHNRPDSPRHSFATCLNTVTDKLDYVSNANTMLLRAKFRDSTLPFWWLAGGLYCGLSRATREKLSSTNRSHTIEILIWAIIALMTISIELTIGPVKNVTPPNFQEINEAHKNRWLQKSAGIHHSIVHIALPVI